MFAEEGIRLFGVIDFRMADVVDIMFVSIVFYYVFLLFRGTRAVHMFVGFGLLVSVYSLSLWWDLKGVSWLFTNLATVGVVSLVILFQPELRGALTRLGQSASKADLRKIFFQQPESESMILELVAAVQELSRLRYGALIVLENKVGLKSYIDTGEEIGAKISSRLLRTIFFPNCALHDGAVIIQNQRIAAAGCVLPVQTGADASEDQLGMRHRAARTLAGESDAVIIVVSEESGIVSLAFRNSLRRRLNGRALEEELKKYVNEEQFS
jgi:diadenylate cyclase